MLLSFSYYVQMEQLKFCSNFFFQDVHIFKFFKEKKLFNFIANAFESYKQIHFNNDVMKICFS
jgi:hypothetical protein